MANLSLKSQNEIFKLLELDSVEPINKSFIEREIKQGIYIYGAGELGKLALNYCEACKIKIMGVVDNYKSGYLKSDTKKKYQIKKPYEIDRYSKNKFQIAITIANIEIKPILFELKRNGWKKTFPFYDLTTKTRSGHPLNNGWKVGKMDDKEKSSVKFIFETLSDETSIKHYEAFISWHISGIELNPKNHPIQNHERYSTPFFIKALKQSKRNKCLLDIGAHHSEVTKKLTAQNISFENYYLFEPDIRSRNYLFKNKKKISPKNSKFYISKKIIGKSQEKLGFVNNLGYCSQIWPYAKNKFKTYKLDSLQIKPDLIKIHTEGTELDVLMGAKKTIINYNPFLVFSVYHRREGFYSDITTPIKNFKNYNWFFRLHGFQGTGAFMYGIPI